MSTTYQLQTRILLRVFRDMAASGSEPGSGLGGRGSRVYLGSNRGRGRGRGRGLSTCSIVPSNNMIPPTTDEHTIPDEVTQTNFQRTSSSGRTIKPTFSGRAFGWWSLDGF